MLYRALFNNLFGKCFILYIQYQLLYVNISHFIININLRKPIINFSENQLSSLGCYFLRNIPPFSKCVFSPCFCKTLLAKMCVSTVCSFRLLVKRLDAKQGRNNKTTFSTILGNFRRANACKHVLAFERKTH